MSKMRAARLVEIGRMDCEEIEMGPLEPGNVRVQTEMASICGSDLHRVMMGALMDHELPCPHGYPGHEGIGLVVESQSEQLQEGTYVLTFPNTARCEGFNEYQRIDAKYCLPLPESDVSRPELMMAQQFGTVIYAMNQHPRDIAGKTVVVIGQGSAGLFWTYLVKRAGASKIIVSDLSDARLKVSKQYGADICINAGQDDLLTVVMDHTQGKGADYVVEAVGQSQTLLQSVEAVNIDGEVHWFGLPSVDENIPFSFAKFFRKRVRAVTTYGAQDEPGSPSFREALDLIHQKKIDVSPLLSHRYPIEDINQAMEVAHRPVDEEALKVSVHFG